MSNRRKTTSPGMIRRNEREANELAGMLTRVLVPYLGEIKANRLSRKALLGRSMVARAAGAKEVQAILGMEGANELHKLVVAKTTFRNER